MILSLTMARNLGWREAITQVLKASSSPMHYADIAEQINKRELREDFGATPANTVAAIITTSIRNDGSQSALVRVSRGIYSLKTAQGAAAPNIVGGWITVGGSRWVDHGGWITASQKIFRSPARPLNP